MMSIENGINFAYIQNDDTDEIIFCTTPTDFIEKISILPKNTAVSGYFSGYIKKGETYYLWRDPLGLGKLYVYLDSLNIIKVSKSWIKLAREGANIKSIYALPKGKLIIYNKGKFTLERVFKLPLYTGEAKDIPYILNKRINQLYRQIASKLPESNNMIFLALSGGLDSSYLLDRASKCELEVYPYTLKMPGSEDAKLAKIISSKLNIDHSESKVDENNMLTALKASSVLCEDWRDFNVHCGAINLLIAKNIHRNFSQSGKKLFILTGDLMNEYVCDYHTEWVNGKGYYKLPSIPKKKLQKYLINGLSTSSREDSIFSNYGISTIQPYAIVSDLYLSLNEEELTREDCKRYLNLLEKDNWLLNYISQEKLRAQVGSKETMGMLGLAIKNNLNDKTFLKSIAEHIDQNESEILDIIYAGNFRLLEVL